MNTKTLIPADPVKALRASLLAERVSEAKTEAIAQADAELNNAGLPTYTELLAALRLGYRHLNGGSGSLTAMEFDAAFKMHRDLLARAGGAA